MKTKHLGFRALEFVVKYDSFVWSFPGEGEGEGEGSFVKGLVMVVVYSDII